MTVSTASVQGMTPLHLFTDGSIKEWSVKTCTDNYNASHFLRPVNIIILKVMNYYLTYFEMQLASP